jgi:hypothetical protein
MLSTFDICENIYILDESYINASSSLAQNLFSKLAVLELCGWIEQSMDDIIRECYIRILGNNYHNEIEVIIQKTHGFDYKKCFRPMLIQITGLKDIENLEDSFDLAKFLKLKSTLGELKKVRGKYAHTHHTEEDKTPIDSPSRTETKIKPIFEGLQEIDEVFKKLRY